ncbi:MAG: hypothetical protein AB8E15_00120 [Bdellovibrionales bacterium]
MITGTSTERDLKKALSLGAESYIIKPFEVQHVIDVVKKLIHKEETKQSYDLSVKSSSTFAKAKLSSTSKIKVVNITDSSLTIHTDMDLKEDHNLVVESTVFDRMGFKSQTMKISDIKKEEDHYRVRLLYKNLDQEKVQKIRNWILGQKNKIRKEVAS